MLAYVILLAVRRASDNLKWDEHSCWARSRSGSVKCRWSGSHWWPRLHVSRLPNTAGPAFLPSPYSPKHLRGIIKDLKSSLTSPDLRERLPLYEIPSDRAVSAFGVDLLIPSLGPTARKTNYDYTKGLLNDLISVIIEEKAKLFVCAVGVPPPDVVKRLHDAGIVCMNVRDLRQMLRRYAQGEV